MPTDFSRNAARALYLAVPLARQVGGQITLLHVLDWPLMPPLLRVLVQDENDLTCAAEARLAKLARASVPKGLLRDTVVRKGAPYEEIDRAARLLKADLIVMATHGRTGLKRVLLGSTTERVVRHAQCPVLTVRSGTPAPSPSAASLAPRINRILVPVDFSARSKDAVQFAARLARVMRADLTLLHVAEPLPLPLFARFPDELALYGAEALEEARRKLDAVATLVPKDVSVKVMLRTDAPALGILHAARTRKSDLIVLPTRGLTGARYILLGSTAEAVVRQAPCPVLTIGQSSAR